MVLSEEVRPGAHGGRVRPLLRRLPPAHDGRAEGPAGAGRFRRGVRGGPPAGRDAGSPLHLPPRRIRHPLPQGPAGGSQGPHRAPRDLRDHSRDPLRPARRLPPPRTVCVEANRFAAAVLLQPDAFALFAKASGYDVLALQKQYGCSYATATLRLAEVMRRQPLMAVLYERRRREKSQAGPGNPRPRNSWPRWWSGRRGSG